MLTKIPVTHAKIALAVSIAPLATIVNPAVIAGILSHCTIALRVEIHINAKTASFVSTVSCVINAPNATIVRIQETAQGASDAKDAVCVKIV